MGQELCGEVGGRQSASPFIQRVWGFAAEGRGSWQRGEERTTGLKPATFGLGNRPPSAAQAVRASRARSAPPPTAIASDIAATGKPKFGDAVLGNLRQLVLALGSVRIEERSKFGSTRCVDLPLIPGGLAPPDATKMRPRPLPGLQNLAEPRTFDGHPTRAAFRVISSENM